jgi:hypothetical protein
MIPVQAPLQLTEVVVMPKLKGVGCVMLNVTEDGQLLASRAASVYCLEQRLFAVGPV